MALRIEGIEFRDFRSYGQLRLEGLGPLTVLVGPNAVGKTNIVEGIQLLTALVSFRRPTIDQMIRRGASSARISSHVSDGNRELDVELRLEGHARRFLLNGKGKRPADLKGLIPSVTFTPDDLDLVKGPMGNRRRALDVLGSQLSASYHTVLKDYEKVIQHKNRLLRDEASDLMIDSIDEMLLISGSQLTCYRAALVARLAPKVERRYAEIAGAGEQLEMRYRPSWEVHRGADSRSGRDVMDGGDREGDPSATVAAACAAGVGDEGASSESLTETISRDEARRHLEAALMARRAEERARRRAVVGPQGDAITFAIDGMDASLYGSQGQQRSVVLAWKLAEAAVIEEMLDQKPVLLLDDVMSELDKQRRAALVSYISDDAQTFITTANLNYFDEGMLQQARVIQLPLP